MYDQTARAGDILVLSAVYQVDFDKPKTPRSSLLGEQIGVYRKGNREHLFDLQSSRDFNDSYQESEIDRMETAPHPRFTLRRLARQLSLNLHEHPDDVYGENIVPNNYRVQLHVSDADRQALEAKGFKFDEEHELLIPPGGPFGCDKLQYGGYLGRGRDLYTDATLSVVDLENGIIRVTFITDEGSFGHSEFRLIRQE